MALLELVYRLLGSCVVVGSMLVFLASMPSKLDNVEPTATEVSRLAGLGNLSHAQLLQIATAGCEASTEVTALAEAILADTQRVVEGVLHSSDLVRLVLAPLKQEDGAAAAVCSQWADDWKATSEDRGPDVVYVLGGSTGSDGDDPDTCFHLNEAYDPRTDNWTQMSTMPDNRGGGEMVRDGTNFDPVSGRWDLIPINRSRGRCYFGGVALDGKVYVMGGSAAGGYYKHPVLNTMDMYDPESDRWQPLAGMAEGRERFAVATAGGKIYVVGGTTTVGNYQEDHDYHPVGTVEVFDPLVGTWRFVSSMSVSRYEHAVAVVDGKIYAIGGHHPNYYDLEEYRRKFCLCMDSVEAYDPQTDSWQQVASMPHGRRMHAATAMGGKIFVTGGTRLHETSYGGDGNECHQQHAMRAVMVLDPQANTWAHLARMGTHRAGHASAVVCGNIYVFGGVLQTTYMECYDSNYHDISIDNFDPDSTPSTSSVEVYDVTSDTWANVTRGPTFWETTGQYGLVAVSLRSLPLSAYRTRALWTEVDTREMVNLC